MVKETKSASEKEREQEGRTLMESLLLVKHPRLLLSACNADGFTDRFDVTTVLHAHSNVPAVRAYSDKPLPVTLTL